MIYTAFHRTEHVQRAVLCLGFLPSTAAVLEADMLIYRVVLAIYWLSPAVQCCVKLVHDIAKI